MTLALCTCIPHRYLVVIFCFIITLLTIGYRACFALMATHISFFNSTDSNLTSSDGSSIFPNCTTIGTSRSKVVDWSGSTVSLFNTAYFIGQFVMSIPAGALVMRFSPKRLFGLTLLTSSVLQLLLPIATDVHVWLTFLIRTVQGALEAFTIPAMSAVISAWAPKIEKARLINFAFSGGYLSPALALFSAGATACYVSWDSIMYIYGSLGVAFCVMWSTVIASSPATHPRILEEEESLLRLSGVSTTTKANSNQSVPWCKFFRSMPVFAIWVAAFSRNFIFALLITEVQQYYKDVYNLSPSMNGLLSGVPSIFMVIFMLSGACMFDQLVKRNILSVTNTRKLAQCSGFGIQGACTLAIGFVNDHIQAFILLSVGVAFSGFAISGVIGNERADRLAGNAAVSEGQPMDRSDIMRAHGRSEDLQAHPLPSVDKMYELELTMGVARQERCTNLHAVIGKTQSYQTNPLDLAPQFAGPLAGISRTGILGSVISTILVSTLTGHSHSLRDWQHVFIITGCVHLAGVVFYGIFASGSLQPWASDIQQPITASNYSAISASQDVDNTRSKYSAISASQDVDNARSKYSAISASQDVDNARSKYSAISASQDVDNTRSKDKTEAD